MARIAKINFLGKDIQVSLKEDVITQATIKNAFLLPVDSVISLHYEANGQVEWCKSNLHPEPSFSLPLNWENTCFEVESDKLPLNAVAPTSDLPLYVPIEVDDLIKKLENFLFYEENDENKACFTVLSSHHAITYHHGHHEKWVQGQVVTIKNQEGDEFETNVIDGDIETDFIVVKSKKPLVKDAPVIGVPSKLERYVLLGYPESNSEYHALEGVFASIGRDEFGRMRGSSGSQLGYSGGPIFNYRKQLLGINVANESPAKFRGFNGQTTVHEIVREISATFPCLSIIVPAYFIAAKYHKDCRFK